MADLRMEPLEDDEVVWEDPPEPSSKYQHRLQQLREHPFRSQLWNPAATSSSPLGSSYKAKGFLTKSVGCTLPDGTKAFRVYVKFVGPAFVNRGWDYEPTEEEIEGVREAALRGTRTPFANVTADEHAVRRPYPRRRHFSPEFKATMVERVLTAEAEREGRTGAVAQIAQEYDLTPSVLAGWVKAAKSRQAHAKAARRVTKKQSE